MKKSNYPNLLSPTRINKLILKNKIIATPCGPINLKALGGAAVVMTGSVAVDCKKSFWYADSPYPFSRYEVEKQRIQITEAHFGGAKIAVELFHVGMWCRVAEDDFAWGPSDCVLDNGTKIKELTYEEMDVIVDAYARTAKDAKDLGYDMLFMHFAHGWLASSFLSPYFNKRTDEYGGPIENRAKFPLRILKAVREAVGPDFPIDMRVNADDKLDGGIVFDDVIKFVQMASKYIDAVQLSCGQDIIIEGNVHMATTNLLPKNYNVQYSVELKKHIKNILVYAVGAIMDVDEAEMLLAEGKVDLIAMGRQLIADPDLPKKIIENRVEDITPCVRCLQCYHISTNRRNAACTVNPTALRPYIPSVVNKTESPKHVVVIGGGPAGITAALTADKAGHNVTLIEKENELGGLLRYISKEHFKSEYKKYLQYLKRQIAKSTIDVRVNTLADKKYIENLNPDNIVIAVGAKQFIPDIEGINGKNVLTIFEAISNPEKIGEKVSIIGAGVVGVEIAIGLAEFENKKVKMIEITDDYASTANKLYKEGLRQKIESLDNIEIRLNTSCSKINEKSIEVIKNGIKEVIETDTVIIATGLKVDINEVEQFYGITPYTAIAGDCVRPRIIMEAVFEGYSCGMNIGGL
jgi:2,4-dienoyl-CoA reductase-like NADH-dependent reductase (Old Yellow Enzyme family)/thioredoxin reductase